MTSTSSVFFVICALNWATVTSSRYVNVIAHQVNTPDAIRWALGQGANGIEIDLNFDGTHPVNFYHGKPCDCSCMLNPTRDNGCSAVENACTAFTNRSEMMNFLGSNEISQSRLALIYIDAKLDKWMRNYAEAGANVVRMLNENVLARGYRGQILLGCYTISNSDYLRGALKEAAKSNYADRYFYTIDVEGKRVEKVMQESLQLQTNNIVYATGISACFPIPFYDAIQKSVKKNIYAAVGIWTVDKESIMKRYLEAGVDFILTNRPVVAVNLIGSSQIPLPGKALIAKSVIPRPVAGSLFWECDCSFYYRFPTGGCAITKMAPPNYACRCSYKGAWTCGGQTVTCPDMYSQLCRTPDSSELACLFGGGSCKGYF